MQPTPNDIAIHQHPTGLDRVRDYIRNHYTEEMDSAGLARLAGLSRFHFHRVFRETFGETPRDHIRRIRLEKSACMLLADEGNRITDVAYDCGFSSSQSFARAFKIHYGIPPTELGPDRDVRRIGLKKIENMKSSYGKKYLLPREIRSDGAFIKIPACTKETQAEDSLQELEVLDMTSVRVAYIRTIAHPSSTELFAAMNRLAMWAMPKGLFTGHSQIMGAMEIIPDPEGRLTFDSCISVPDEISADESRGISVRYLPGGEYGIYHGKFQTQDQAAETLRRLIRRLWISSYYPRKIRPLYQIFYNDPNAHPTKTWFIDTCLPISTLPPKASGLIPAKQQDLKQKKQ